MAMQKKGQCGSRNALPWTKERRPGSGSEGCSRHISERRMIEHVFVDVQFLRPSEKEYGVVLDDWLPMMLISHKGTHFSKNCIFRQKLLP